MNPDDHYRYRKFIPEHRNSGGTHPRLGKTESDNHIEFRLSRMHSSMRNRDTCIEKQLYSYLDSTKLVYEKQKQIGRTRPDAFIPSLNLCIYADGRYWHCREKDTDRDARGEEILKTRGYSFIRLNDLEKMNSLDIKPLQDCIGRLVEA
jgi:very-short-patch-repair endonuclease